MPQAGHEILVEKILGFCHDIDRPHKLSNQPGRVVLTGAGRAADRESYADINAWQALQLVQSPLRSRAVSLIPFFRPSAFTTCSSAGIVRLRRGEMQMPVSIFGVSSSGLSVPTSAGR